jgi:hypothetical protein
MALSLKLIIAVIGRKKESFPRRTLIETILSSPNPATGLLAISWKF